jgi:hypothetical protein
MNSDVTQRRQNSVEQQRKKKQHLSQNARTRQLRHEINLIQASLDTGKFF